MADLAKLKEEIAKPEYLGLGDVEVAKRLNQSDRQVNRESIDSGSLVAAITPTEFTALAPLDKEYLNFLVNADTLPIDKQLRDYLSDVFPAGSVTRTRLRAILKRTGSRADELSLGRVNESDVADARRL